MPCTTVTDQHLMHHGTQCPTPLPLTAQAIWDGQAILATNGSVKNGTATYAWILSTTNDNIKLDISISGLLHPSAPYSHHASKHLEVATLYAALTWIMDILHKYLNNISQAGNTPALPIPVNNKSVINNIHHPITNLTPTF